MHLRRHIRPALFLAAAALLAACASMLAPSPQRSRFFVLNPLPASAAPATPLDANLSLGVFSADFPDYLNRPQMITRVTGDQIVLNEYLRWGEPLNSGFSRVLAQDLTLISGSNKVAVFPFPQAFGQEFELFAQVFRFDGHVGGEVTLRVLWRVTGPGGRQAYFSKNSTFTRTAPTTPDPVSGYFDTLNLLVGDLAREIVDSAPAIRASRAAAPATNR